MTEDHARALEREMLEAVNSKMATDPAEKDPLLIILWRLNHQDKALDGIRSDLGRVSTTLNGHITQNEAIKDAVDELVTFWVGSKIAGRIMTWVFGVLAAAGAAYVSFKKDLFT